MKYLKNKLLFLRYFFYYIVNKKISMKKSILFTSVVTSLLLLSCKDTTEKRQDVSSSSKLERKYKNAQDFTYSNWVLKSNDSVRKIFKKNFSSKQLTTIVALNRVDKNTFYTMDTLVIPDKFDDDFLAYSPFPYTLSEAKQMDKLAIFSYEIQAYGLYENGELIKWGPTSMGSKQHLTPEGLFFTNWKGEEIQSTFDDEWILRWNFNIQNEEGIGWHQYALPGYPASHSCLRLLEDDARWMFDWADQWVLKDDQNVDAKGTPVIVFGSYDFEGRKPWLNLASNNKANDISKEDLNGVVNKYKAEILKEQENRKNFVAK